MRNLTPALRSFSLTATIVVTAIVIVVIAQQRPASSGAMRPCDEADEARDHVQPPCPLVQ
jgi:hypothetical protein